MLSALIPAEHSYPAIHLVAKPVDQRFVHPDPLVQRTTSLKRQRLQQIETNLSHACFRILLCASDCIFTEHIKRYVLGTNVQSLRARAYKYYLCAWFPRYCLGVRFYRYKLVWNTRIASCDRRDLMSYCLGFKPLKNRFFLWFSSLTVWTQLACHFNWRTAKRLGPSPAPRCGEPTSRCRAMSSIWTLGHHQPVIPGVAFSRCLQSFYKELSGH
jgi:hypothetical protein